MNKLSRRGFCKSAAWSSSAAEKKVWEDFGKYVEHQLGVKSVATLTPSSGYPTKLDLQLVSGTASLVTALNGTLIPTYAARGAHRPLDDLIAADPDFELDDFYDTSRKISSFNGKTYAIGFDVAPTVMYYNKDLLKKQGIPLPPRDGPGHPRKKAPRTATARPAAVCCWSYTCWLLGYRNRHQRCSIPPTNDESP